MGFAVAGESTPPDPGLQILSPLTAEDQKKCRELFAQLASENFDTREQALNALVAKGTAVLPIATEFEKHSDAEVASQATGMRQRILFNYDGYLPTSPILKMALRNKISSDFKKSLKDLLDSFAGQTGIKLVHDPAIKSEATDDPIPGTPFAAQGKVEGVAEEFMIVILSQYGLVAVPRGDVYLITTPQTAQRLATQRHTFDWSSLGLGRDEAERVGKAFSPFFPQVGAELHTASEVLIVRGDEAAIPRAARLIALLKPGAPDAVWPTLPDGRGSDTAALAERLSAPITITLAAQDPLDALAQLKKQKQEVFAVSGPDPGGEARNEPPYSPELDGASPLRLTLRDLPLGLALRWIERRAKFPAEGQAETVLGFEIGPGGRLQFRLRPRSMRVLDMHVGGADLAFLYPRSAKLGAESDAVARAALLEFIEPHLALFPEQNLARGLAVLRGRLLMQGHYATLARTLDLVREWREKGAPPAPPAWKSALDARLNTPIDWDGRAMTGGKVIGALRKLGNITLLIEDAPDGSVADFSLTPEDAQLLPPGKHTLRALLDDLCQKAGAEWRIVLGVVVLIPKPGR